MPNKKASTQRKARRFIASRAFLFSALALQLTSCGPQPAGLQSAELATRVNKTLGCAAEFESSFYDGLYDLVLAKEPFASSSVMQQLFLESLQNGRLAKLSAQDLGAVNDALVELYGLLSHETIMTLVENPADSDQIIEALAAMETGDRSTPARDALQTKIRAKFDEIKQLLMNAGELPSCETKEDFAPEPDAFFQALATNRHPMVAGGLKALSVAYQSCDASSKRALNQNTPDLEGITITGNVPGTPGRKREITDLRGLVRSHPYLRDYRKPSASCFDVLRSPMIYDFGGKPYQTSSTSSTLDFFKNFGGTRVLGIDCSGYVFASMATAGLRLSKGVKMKPIHVRTTPAAKWMKPRSSGLSCFSPVSMGPTKTVEAGDILASSGHVMIIDTVGSDPFGIDRFTSESECRLSNMSSSRFNMTFLQSGSAKGGMGINRIRPTRFLPEDEAPMEEAMLQYAVAACKAKFKRQTIAIQPSTATIVRHSGSSDCLDRKIKLAHEECVASCAASAALEIED